MKRVLGWCCLLAVWAFTLAGCAAPNRADDPAATAVRDAHSAVAGLVLSVQQLLDQRSTSQVTQVALEGCLDEVSTAQQELVTASDADPGRRTTATAAVKAAVDALVGLGARGASELTRDDLAHLQQAEQALAAAAKELHA